jgi:hypothetical protein
VYFPQRDPILIHTRHAVPLPLPWCAVFQATQGHGMPCVNQQRPSLDGLWVTCPASVSSDYRAELTNAVFTALISHKLNCSCERPREIPIVIDEEKLTVFVQEHGTDTTFSIYCRYVSLILMISSGMVKCCDCDGACVFSHVFFHTDIIS